MPIYVKEGGTWREISSDAGSQLYVRDGTSFTNKTINNAYIKDGGSWRTVFTLFDTPAAFNTASSGQSTFSVPANANAIHIKQAVAGGGGSMNGLGYDKGPDGEQGGRGGGSGAYVSDKVFTVVGGETLTAEVGTGGSAGSNAGFNYTASASAGTNTTLSGSSTGSLFSLIGGGGASYSGGGVQGPTAIQTSGSAGSATISSSLSTGTTADGINITGFNTGRAGSFNSGGDGAQGFPQTGPSKAPLCSGDNCSIGGADGAPSYNGQVSGGAAGGSGSSGTAGTFGAGGGGGGKEASGAAGGAGELVYRFMRIT
jgi:hypothetical protein